MNVFDLRDHLVHTYEDYTKSFMRFREGRVDAYVQEKAFDSGRLWPHPSVGLNPSYRTGSTVDELVKGGVLHADTEPIFRLGKDETDAVGRRLPLYLHQRQAIESAAADRNYVLTTGTGSGKSLAYIIPIVDHVLRVGSGGGVKAIIVYPMNALVNSQREELEKFLHFGPWENPPVTYKRYTGQDNQEDRRAIQDNPPDILLTNYVMLELILTRYTDRRLVKAFGNLRFLVLDELHSYRGRQGADVALLVRRLREMSGSAAIRCVGTSATLSTEGDHESRKKDLAEVSSRLFGTRLEASDIIGETLERVTPERDMDNAGFIAELTESVLRAQPPGTPEGFVSDPMSCWIESTFGLRHEGNRLVRAVPLPVKGRKGAAEQLSGKTGVDDTLCEDAIQEYLMAGNTIENPKDPRHPVFPFRLHQFISRGDTVYASPEPTTTREFSLSGQRFVPDSDQKRVLLPLVFCRACGQDYYLVHRQPTGGGQRLIRRDLDDNKNRDHLVPGFVYLNDNDPWPENDDEARHRLPGDWFDPDTNRLRSNRREQAPQPILVNPDGSLGGNGVAGWWVPAPFRFCLACGVTYSTGTADFARLSTLGAGGRASATTVLSLATARYLRENPQVDTTAQKMLSFTDNRQDASLQAGHFNDFVEVTMLRSALWQAVKNSPGGLRHDELPHRVFDALRLPRELYALDPDVRGWAEKDTDQTMRDVLEYRLYHDLKRGWRVSQPNLEQAGLLVIEYMDLTKLAGDQEMWADCHPALADCSPERRKTLLEVLLDSLRRDLALNVKVFNHHEQESLQRRAGVRLNGTWSLDNEKLASATQAITYPKASTDRRPWIKPLTARGLFGGYLRGAEGLGALVSGRRITLDETDGMIKQIFERLRRYGILAQAGGKLGKELWQINVSALIWKAGDGTRPYRDRLRIPRAPSENLTTNRFFVDLYRNSGGGLVGIEAREHTAQVSNEDRMEREERFRSGDLPVLYCSPTMELGVDISKLNVVNMRERSSHTRQLCPAVRAGRPRGATRVGVHLLLVGQQP